jgi:RNA polymerase sigma-70 factor (ECF subfamily)
MSQNLDAAGQPEASDGEVVRAVLAGDVERYAVLVRRYRDRYARYAARMLDSADAAEDAVQDAFVRAFDQLSRCREPEKFAGWFFLILRNRCFAERRRNRRQQGPGGGVPDHLPAPEGADTGLERAEQRRALQQAMGALTPDQREVLLLKHIEGMSYEAIAALTRATVPSLKMRMHRAYDRLRRALTGEE